MGCDVQKQHELHIYYDGIVVGKKRVDLLVDNAVLVTVQGNDKTEQTVAELRQLLLVSDQRLGLIARFNQRKPQIEQATYKL